MKDIDNNNQNSYTETSSEDDKFETSIDENQNLSNSVTQSITYLTLEDENKGIDLYKQEQQQPAFESNNQLPVNNQPPMVNNPVPVPIDIHYGGQQVNQPPQPIKFNNLPVVNNQPAVPGSNQNPASSIYYHTGEQPWNPAPQPNGQPPVPGPNPAPDINYPVANPGPPVPRDQPNQVQTRISGLPSASGEFFHSSLLPLAQTPVEFYLTSSTGRITSTVKTTGLTITTHPNHIRNVLAEAERILASVEDRTR